MNTGAKLPFFLSQTPIRIHTGWLDWHDLRWMGEGSRLAGELRRRQADLRPGEPANIQFTSGEWQRACLGSLCPLLAGRWIGHCAPL